MPPHVDTTRVDPAHAFDRFDCPLCLQPCHDTEGFINHMAVHHGGLISDRKASFRRVRG